MRCVMGIDLGTSQVKAGLYRRPAGPNKILMTS
jgi:sugar (pentulose or hexulose) kinase